MTALSDGKRSFGLAAAALAAIVCAAPAPASAQSAPISVSSCTVLQYQGGARRPFWFQPPGPARFGSLYTDGVKIVYANTTNKVITRVGFRVNYRGDIERVIDVGTFSPGVTIDHSFGEFSGLAYLGPRPNECRAVAVRFADGSSWHRPK